jgi:hypothetical protein
MIPEVTVPPKPNGLPIASTMSPTLDISESPQLTGWISTASGSIFRTAISVLGSVPTNSAGTSSMPLLKMTVI